jgi:hypothetical protein
MEDNATFKMPTIDFSAQSLLILAQFGFFAVFAYWGYEGATTTSDYIFPLMMGGAGLALFLSVPNARMGATLGIPAIMVVWGLAMGENELLFWAIMMLIIVGSIAHIPALAIGDPSLGLDDESRVRRLGLVYTLFLVFMLFMFSSLPGAAMDGEVTDQDSDGNEIVYTLESTEQTIGQAGLGFGAIGILVFLLTAVMGMEVGPARPWHGGLLFSAAFCLDAYIWITIDATGSSLIPDALFALAACGLFILAPCIAYEGK